ncbi:MAG TPA: putative porin [Bacteroidia bacterium]|nr:putative porin [Bacteroidia bacterium]
MTILIFCSGFFNGYAFENLKTDSLNKNKGDTSLTGFQFSRPGTGAFFYWQTLGNLGSAFRSVNFWDERKEFFNTGLNAFKVYEFTEAMNFDLPKRKTFSELKFINGSKREQDFSIKHFQRLTNEISAGLDFGIAHSDGYYNKQVSNLRKFNVYAAFGTPTATPKSSRLIGTGSKGDFEKRGTRYNLLLNYLSNKIVSQENGGLENDSSFEFAGSFDSKTAGVNFNDVRNQLKSKVFYVQQRFNFFKSSPPGPLKGESSSSDGDSLTNGSLAIAKELMKEGPDSAGDSGMRFYLKHVFKYERRSALFTADNFYDSFFEHAYYDTTRTDDSLFVRNFFNELSLNVENAALLKGKAAFYLAGNHQYFGFYQVDTVNALSAVDTVLRNISVRPGGSIEWENGLGADFYFEKSFNDLKFDFYKAFASVSLTPNPSPEERGMLARTGMRLKLSLEKEMRNPDFVYSYFNSNHFIWFNQFNPIDFLKAELSAEAKFSKQYLKVTGGLFSVKNLTYFNEEALPQQFHENINVLNVGLFHSIKFGKFNLVNDLKYQHADKKEIVRLPDFSSYTSFFYDDNFFKRALYGQFGVDVRYCTLYFADAYMPATRQFFLQDEKEIGNYAYVDVFANFRIKTFRFFLKLEHLNAGFTERVYYTVPHYPMPGRTLKVGIVWRFID